MYLSKMLTILVPGVIIAGSYIFARIAMRANAAQPQQSTLPKKELNKLQEIKEKILLDTTSSQEISNGKKDIANMLQRIIEQKQNSQTQNQDAFECCFQAMSQATDEFTTKAIALINADQTIPAEEKAKRIKALQKLQQFDDQQKMMLTNYKAQKEKCIQNDKDLISALKNIDRNIRVIQKQGQIKQSTISRRYQHAKCTML